MGNLKMYHCDDKVTYFLFFGRSLSLEKGMKFKISPCRKDWKLRDRRIKNL